MNTQCLPPNNTLCDYDLHIKGLHVHTDTNVNKVQKVCVCGCRGVCESGVHNYTPAQSYVQVVDRLTMTRRRLLFDIKVNLYQTSR
jgi:hypothetical protein